MTTTIAITSGKGGVGKQQAVNCFKSSFTKQKNTSFRRRLNGNAHILLGITKTFKKILLLAIHQSTK